MIFFPKLLQCSDIFFFFLLLPLPVWSPQLEYVSHFSISWTWLILQDPAKLSPIHLRWVEYLLLRALWPSGHCVLCWCDVHIHFLICSIQQIYEVGNICAIISLWQRRALSLRETKGLARGGEMVEKGLKIILAQRIQREKVFQWQFLGWPTSDSQASSSQLQFHLPQQLVL